MKSSQHMKIYLDTLRVMPHLRAYFRDIVRKTKICRNQVYA